MRELRAVWLTDTLVLLLIQVNHPSIVCFGSGQDEICSRGHSHTPQTLQRASLLSSDSLIILMGLLKATVTVLGVECSEPVLLGGARSGEVVEAFATGS